MKTLFKKALSAAAALVMLVALFPVALPASAAEGNGLTYYPCGSFHGDYIEVSDASALVVKGDYVIPSYFPNYSNDLVPVTTLRTGSFDYLPITSVVIPDTVTSLGSGYTFDGCRQMKKVTLSKNVTVIPSYGFANCDVLESINLGDKVTEIEWNAFSGCPNLTLVLPLSIKEIGDNAFGGSYGGAKLVYYPGTAAQWKQVIKGYGVEETVLCPSAIDEVTSTAKGIKVTAAKRNATKYTFYRQQKVKGSWSSWKTVKTATTNSFTDTTAAIGGTYRYAVTATKGVYTTQRSEASESLTHLPTTTVKVSKASKGFKVSWSKVSGASKYIVYRRTGTGKWKTLKTTSSRSYTDKSAKYGYEYQYGVKVVKGSAKSALSKTEPILRLASPKVKVAAGTYKDGSLMRSGIKVTWGKVRKAANYEVYRREGNGPWMMCTVTSSRSYVDYWPTSGKYNSYKVVATDGFHSASGTSKKVMYLGTPEVEVYDLFNYVSVNWNQIPGAKKYVVYRQVGSGKWKKIKTTTAVGFADSSVKWGKTYRYKVVAINGKRKSGAIASRKVKF